MPESQKKTLMTAVIVVIILFVSSVIAFLYLKDSKFPFNFLTPSFQTQKNKNYKPYIPPREKLNDEFGLRGWWQKADKTSAGEKPKSKKEKEALDNLKSIGYLSGYEKAGTKINVTIYKDSSAVKGVNLYNSGHSPEAFLIDMKGNVIHKWHYDFKKAFPKASYTKLEVQSDSDLDYWRRVHLFENGDLLAIYEGYGIIKIDKDSNLLWKLQCGAHHDLDIGEEGKIYTLAREEKNIASINSTKNVLEEFIITVSSDGKELSRTSIIEAFKNSTYSSFLNTLPLFGDLLHTNSIRIIKKDSPQSPDLFKKGNIIISMRNTDIIAVIDLMAGKVIWALTGQWHRQHEATLLENGDILLFDNLGKKDFSQIIELNPLTQKIVWSYDGNGDNTFFSEYCGTNQRLSNGNTLITVSNSGRAFEITPEKEIVWEFYNPNRAGKKKELIATLFECMRLPAKYASPFK